MITNLVTKADLDGYKYVADSIKNHITWTQFVSEAQLLDVKAWLGDALLMELISQTVAGTVTALNTTLLDGGTYTYGSRTYYFQGLKACIIYYAFARFTNRSAVNYTAAGIVIKESDFSTPVTDKMVQRLETEARLTADALKCDVISYLNRKSSDYPLWRQGQIYCRSGCKDNRPFKVLGD